MKLLNLLITAGRDFDVYDTTFDTCVTCCSIDFPQSDYDWFCTELYRKVDVESAEEYTAVASWSGLICRNKEKFRIFSQRFWRNQYEDDDDFVYQWVKELHAYISGCVPEDFYTTLLEFVRTLDTDKEYKADSPEERNNSTKFKYPSGTGLSMIDFSSRVKITSEADKALANILAARYENLDQYSLVSDINDLEVAKVVIKRLLDERVAAGVYGCKD